MSEIKVDPKKIQEFLLAHPEFLVFAGMAVLSVLQRTGKPPAWAADLPALNERLAGPWRGKGSFGHGFGPQARHR